MQKTSSKLASPKELEEMKRTKFIREVFSTVTVELLFTGFVMAVMIVFELQKCILHSSCLWFFVFLVSALYLTYGPWNGMLQSLLWTLFTVSCGFTFAVLPVLFPINPTLTAALLTAVIIFAFGEIVARTSADLTRLHSVHWQMQRISFGAGILAAIQDSKILTVCVLSSVFLLYLLFVVSHVQMIVKAGYQEGYNTTQRLLAAFELYFDILILFFIISWTLANTWTKTAEPIIPHRSESIEFYIARGFL